jgi:DNA-binding transcriptional LysR family regulator
VQDLNDLYYFVRVVDNGGFAAAARATNMQKSKLSRRIQQLEDRLGVRLVNRSTRQFSVTDVGQEYYERCVAMLLEAEAADQVVAEIRSEPRGLIRVSCPAALMHYGFGPLFAGFLARHRGVKITLESTNRHVDVISEGYDVAIRARFPPLEPTDLVSRKLDLIHLCLVARPDLLDGKTMLSPADLNGLPSIALGPTQRDHHWRLEQASGQTANVSFSPRFVADDMAALRDAALAGVGVVQLPIMMVQQEIDAGRLVHVLPDWKPQTVIVYAVFPSRRGMAPSVRAFLDFLGSEPVSARFAIAPPLVGSGAALPAAPLP